jgi:hypothetical protein
MIFGRGEKKDSKLTWCKLEFSSNFVNTIKKGMKPIFYTFTTMVLTLL